LWDVAAGKEVRRWPAGARPDRFGGRGESDLVLSEDGTTRARLTEGAVIVQDASTGKELRRFTPEQLAAQAKIEDAGKLLLSADGQLLCVIGTTGADKMQLSLWKTATGALVRTQELGDQRTTYPMAMARDGSRVATVDIKGKGIARLR